MTTLYIKKLVEKISGIENIGLKTQKRFIVDLRHIYFALCKIFIKKQSQIKIAETVNIGNHSTVIRGLERFYWLEYQKCYKHNKEVFEKCYKVLEPIFQAEKKNDYNMTNVIKNNQVISVLEARVKKIKRVNLSLIKEMNVEFELVTT